jgi:ATP-dependent exoDNAse (exonuclease V) beta subunit
MKTNITFVTASAGSGKTYRVTEIIEDRLAKGDCRPAGLVATTYTVKAAQELRERVRRRLYDAGRTALAERLNEGLIGTVHSVCGRLLERFAFEAGISPRLEIMANEETVTLLSQAVEIAVDFPTLQRLQALADLLGQRDSKTSVYAWKKQMREVIDAVRANDFKPESLAGMAQRNVEELLDFLPRAATDNLDDELAHAIDWAARQIGGNGDHTKATKEYLYLLKDSLRDLKNDRLPWCAWVKLSKEQPAKKSQTAARPVVAGGFAGGQSSAAS